MTTYILAGLGALELCGGLLVWSLCRAAARRPPYGPALATMKES